MDTKYTFTGDIFGWLGEATPEKLKEGLFNRKGGAPEEVVAADPARDMAQMTVAALGGEDAARKSMINPVTLGPNDYSDLDAWTEAARQSAERVSLMRMERVFDGPEGMEIPPVQPVSTSSLAPASGGSGLQGYTDGEDDVQSIMPPQGLMSPDIEEAPVADTVTVSEVDTSIDDAVAEAMEETVAEDTTTDLSTYTEDYAKVYLKQHEGLKSHKSLEGGKDTAALGIKFSLGLNRTDYESDAEFAGAVALKHRDKAKAKFKEETWDALPQSVKYAITDLNFNNGTIGSTGDKSTTEESMKNTLNYIGMTTKAKEKASLISLAKRRAWNWNKAASDMGVSEIDKIKQIPTASGGTKFEYLASDGTVIHSLTTTRTPVKLNKAGVATTLTETREVDM